jgi:ubiquinone/menaquinone biosynthesis C-methylase UbiE
VIQDQKQMWDRKHAADEHGQWRDEPRNFAMNVVSDLSPPAKILELGCGVGSDARFFASKGLDVTATDFSEVVISQNKQRGESNMLRFEVLDISDPFPYKNESFNAVYAYLSLHYFSDLKTREIFNEIARVLKRGGKLYFSCKSVHDSKYGQGEEIEPNVFSRNGHIRHFFTKEYAKEILSDSFKTITLDETKAKYINDVSRFIECWAEKK